MGAQLLVAPAATFVVAAAWCAEQPAFPQTYQRSVLMELPRGPGLSEVDFAINTGEDAADYGPSDFGLAPDGALLLADVANGSVKRFSRQGEGRVLARFPPGEAEAHMYALLPDEAGGFYTSGARCVHAFGGDGTERWALAFVGEEHASLRLTRHPGTRKDETVELPLPAMLRGEDVDGFLVPSKLPLAVHPDGDLLLRLSNWATLRIAKNGEPVATAPTCCVDGRGLFYGLRAPWTRVRERMVKPIALLTRTGRPSAYRLISLPLNPFSDRSPHPDLHDWYVGQAGNFYATGFYSRDAMGRLPLRRVLRKYSAKGEPLAEFGFPRSRDWWRARIIIVDEEESIYALEFAPDVMRLLKWTLRK